VPGKGCPHPSGSGGAGTAADATRVLDASDRYDPQKAVGVPPTTLIQDHM
jgi:hypothetical protein